MAAKRKNGSKYSVVTSRDTMAGAKTALTEARRGRPAAEQGLFKILKAFGEFKVIRLNVTPRGKAKGTSRKKPRAGIARNGAGSSSVTHRGKRRAGRSQKNAVRAGRKVKRAVFVRGRRNPDFEDSEQAAAEMFETFHGRPAEQVTEFEIPKNERLNVAECGKLRYLNVMSPAGAYKLFPKGVLVCTSPEGGQLYFVGGDQSLDLEGLGVADSLPKDLLEIGPCFEIEYHTSKDFHNFDPIDYFHHFGEESGVLPTLGYDNLNGLFYLQGGNYQVKREGIVD